MKKKYKRPLLITLAVLFLIESWLWDKTGALIARAIALLPFERVKQLIADRIEHLAPLPTLGLFLIPVITLLPLKFVALWMLAKGFVLSGISTVLFAKLAGFGVFSFMFTLCKPKLLQLRFIAWIYAKVTYWRTWALDLVRPYTRYVGRLIRAMKPTSASGKLLAKLRTRMHNARKSL